MLRRPPVILGYHGIADVPPRHDPSRLFVSPDSLRRQVRRLQARGYRFLKMAAFAEALTSGAPLEATCALTFDDGTRDHFELPALLEELGVPGTVYVCPGLAGEAYPWSDPAALIRFMTIDEIRVLARHPLVEIGSHTLRHTSLAEATAEDAEREMAACKDALEDLLQLPVPSFCFPGCAYSPPCPQAARRAGYTSAVTCGARGGWDPFALKREIIHTPDGPVTFELKSLGLYHALKDLPPADFARWATRFHRHRHERG